jgi:hypothetical protein
MAEHLCVLGGGGSVSGVPRLVSADQDRIRVDRRGENGAVQGREPLSLKLLAADSRASRDNQGAERLAHVADTVGSAETPDLVVDSLVRHVPPTEVSKRNKNVGADLALAGQW